MTTRRSPNNLQHFNNTSAKYALPLFALMSLALACGPQSITDSGGETGDTGETSGDGDGDPMPGSEVTCVEKTVDAVTCWVSWTPGLDARIVLECTAAGLITAGVWDSPVELELDGWGLTLCYPHAGNASHTCAWGDSRVRLTETADGWVPEVSALISEHVLAAEPCGETANGRLQLTEFQCVDDICQGRWGGTSLWSSVFDASVVAASIEVPSPWACSTDPDVDICIEVDDQGHIGCFWYQDGWAVAVAPSCAVIDDTWLDVGNDMRATAI